MTSNNETPPPGTPDVEALIRRLEDLASYGDNVTRLLVERLQQVTAKAATALRTLSAANAAQAARIAELEVAVAQAAKAERAKCVDALRARQRKYERLRDQSPSEREADDWRGAAVAYMLAANRLETNGREQG